MACWLLALLGSGALAGGRVALPAGEPAQPWAAALAAAGLESVSSNADVQVEDLGATWRVSLQGAPPVEVAEPQGAVARADLAMLIASLLEPASPLDWSAVGAPPALPPPRAARPARPPAPAPAAPAPAAPQEEPDPAPAPMVAAPSPVVAAEAAPEIVLLVLVPPVDPPPSRVVFSPPPRRRWLPWVELSTRGGARPDLSLAPGVSLSLGAGAPGLALGLRAVLNGVASLPELGGDRLQRAHDWSLLLAARPLPPVELALSPGLSARSWWQGDAMVERAVLPTIGLDLRVALPLAGPARLCAGLGASRDLRAAAAWVGDAAASPLSPWGVYADLGLRWAPDQQFLVSPP